MDQSIIPECFVDTNLIETLVPPQSQYNHQKGCGTVTKVMKEKFPDRFALGIIDRDKHVIDYLQEFDVVSKSDSLFLHKHKNRHHYIIQISPAIERFILECAHKTDVDIAAFGLPADLDLLKKESKSINSKNDARFKNLFKQIRRNRSTEFEKIRNWISYLKANTYHVDLNVLKAF